MSGPMAFADYFNVADEIDESLRAGANQSVATSGLEALTLADLDERSVSSARAAADEHGLPWPPDLAAAEDHLLRSRGAR